MRKTFLVLALVLVSFATLRAADQALTPDEQTFIDKHLSEFVTTKTTRLTDAALAKVFASPIYKIQVIIKGDDGSSTSELLAARVGDKLVNVSSPGSDTDMPTLLKMVDPKFKLAADADATTLQKALDILYPAFGDDDKKVIAFTHKGNDWTFIRGTFFESKKGFIVKTNGDGAITSIKFMLKLP